MAFIVEGLKKGEANEVEAKSPPYELNDIPFYFMRYKYYLKDKLQNIGKKREDDGSIQMVSGQTDISANWKTSKLTPFLEESFWLQASDFDYTGYLYIFYEKGISSTGTDYEEFFLRPVYIESNSNIACNHFLYPTYPYSEKEGYDKAHAEYTEYLNLHPGNVVWVAFSEVRWSDDYRQKIMGNEDALKKRFQKIDVDKYIENCEKIKQEGKTYLSRFIRSEYMEAETHDEETQTYGIKRNTRYFDFCGYIDRNEPMYIIALNSPTLLMQDLCQTVIDGNNYFEQYIKDISTGVNPVSVVDPESGTATKEKCEDREAYRALFTSASALYTILNETKYSDDESYREIINKSQEFKFKKLLDIDNRRYIKREIDQVRVYIQEFFSIPFFQCALLDYYDNIGRRKLEGKEKLQFWLYAFSLDPKSKDVHIYPNSGGYSENDGSFWDYSKDFFFYRDASEESKYQNIDAKNLQYKDILGYNLDIKKLLINAVITEKDLFPLKSEDERARLFSELNDQGNLAGSLTDDTSRAARLLISIENMFVYFSVYVRTKNEWQQLKDQAASIRETLKRNDLDFKSNSLNLDKDFDDKVKNILERFDADVEEINSKRQNVENDAGKIKDKGYHSHEQKVNRSEETQLDLEQKKAELQKQEEFDRVNKNYSKKDSKLAKQYARDHKMQVVRQDKLRIEFDTLEMNANKRTYDIYTSPSWARTIRAISYAGLIAGYYAAMTNEKDNTLDNLAHDANILSGVTQVFSVLIAKNEVALDVVTGTSKKIPWSFRFSYLSTGAQIVADFLFCFASFKRRDYRAASLYFTSASSGMIVLIFSLRGASVAFGTAGRVTIPAPWVAAIATAISIVTGVLASFLEQTDLESMVKGSVFANGRRGGIFGIKTNLTLDENKFKTSFQVGDHLYKKRESFATNEFDGFGFTGANLTQFPVMLDVIRSMSGIFKMKLKGRNAEKIGNGKWMQYNRFRLWFAYPQNMFDGCTIEYEVRIYPFGVNKDTEANKEYFIWEIGSPTPFENQTPSGIEFEFVVNPHEIKQKTAEKGWTSKGMIINNPAMVVLGRLVSATGDVFPSVNKGMAHYYGININLQSPYRLPIYFELLGKPKSINDILFE